MDPLSDTDKELRSLLDSIGMAEQSGLVEDPVSRARGERDLARIVATPHDMLPPGRGRGARRHALIIAAAVVEACLIVGTVVVLTREPSRAPVSSVAAPAALVFRAPSNSPAPGYEAGASFIKDVHADVLALARQARKHHQGDAARIRVYAWQQHEHGYQPPSWSTRTVSAGAPLPAQGDDLWRFLITGPPCAPVDGAEASAHASPTNTVSTSACLLQRVFDTVLTQRLSGIELAELWTTLTQEPNLAVLGTTEDRLGRAALGIAAPVDDSTDSPAGKPGGPWDNELILLASPHTGAVVGIERVTQATTPHPQVLSFTAIE